MRIDVGEFFVGVARKPVPMYAVTKVSTSAFAVGTMHMRDSVSRRVSAAHRAIQTHRATRLRLCAQRPTTQAYRRATRCRMHLVLCALRRVGVADLRLVRALRAAQRQRHPRNRAFSHEQCQNVAAWFATTGSYLQQRQEIRAPP
jgi:hypothetical protein